MDIKGDSASMIYDSERDGKAMQTGESFPLYRSEHPAVKKINSGKYDEVEFETIYYQTGSTGVVSERTYVAYMPLFRENGTYTVLVVDYDWNSFYIELISMLRVLIALMAVGIVLVCLLQIYLLRKIVAEPINTVADTMKKYMEDKDGKAAAKALESIRSGNEITELSGNLKDLTTELDSYISGIKTLTVEVMRALAKTIDAKDKYTNGHSSRVAIYSRMLAKKMGLSREDQENIYYMGLLHDIGKIGVPNEIINKTSRLTDEEYDVIKTHPVLGYEILSELSSRPDLTIGARWHHERYDGKGYPDGLAGEDIPFLARIIAVADSYDAMTSTRSYRSYLPQDVVRGEIEKNLGTQFDPEIGKVMLEIIDNDTMYMLHE